MTTIRTLKQGLKKFRRKIIRNQDERYLDADGYFWYACLICDKPLYSEWTVGAVRVHSTGEWASFCVHHNSVEISNVANMTESQLLDLKYDKPRGN